MLFGYPVAATADNWLHDCMVAAVTTVHQLIEEQKPLPNWPEVIPLAHRAKLSTRHGLRDRFLEYAQAVGKLSTQKRKAVLDAVTSQNRIPELLTGQCECQGLGDLPKSVREPAKSLFSFAFGLLTDLGIRQRQYQEVCDGIPERVCPFCGCEGLDAPGAPQEDLDHYIPRSKYPFAAANLRNLAPMGGRCNSSYKRVQDPLRRDDGVRRLACDPFAATGVTISFDNSVIDELTAGPLVSDWVIDIAPNSEAVNTWDEIFRVRERWKRDVLDEKTFNKWLGDFKSFCKRANIQATDDAQVVEAVQRYQEYLAECGFEGRAFLKAAAFKLLFLKCNKGSIRLMPIFRALTATP